MGLSKEKKRDAHNICQLRLSHQVFRFGPHQLLLEDDELRALGLLDLELLDLVGDLALAVPTRLNALFGVTNGL